MSDTIITENIILIIIYGSCILGLIWALINTLIIRSVKVTNNKNNEYLNLTTYDKLHLIESIAEKINIGASAFLSQEYKIMTIFIAFFSVIIFLIVDLYGQDTLQVRFYATVAYIIGSFTSIICGYIGMKIAVASNYRTTYEANSSLMEAFKLAYRAGCVMGFTSVSLSLLILLSLLKVYIHLNNPTDLESFTKLMELLAGYGLGGSSMALFGRVGGGIFTKAADVGADLVGKVEQDLDEDSPRNPATIADNVGDNVGDIAGMGSDLFGSFAESSCAALVVISSCKDLMINSQVIYFPLIISAFGILACFITSLFGIYVYKVRTIDRIEKSLKIQLFLSTVLVLLFMLPVCKYFLPLEFEISGIKAKWYYAYICISIGLVSGFFIGLSTDYYTSHAHYPVREMAYSCSSGAAINIIYGLSLGYISTVIPVILLALTILVSLKLLSILGIAFAALGMLSTLSIGLAIDVYGPISDNAGGIAEMAELGEEVREITDALDAAGNTTAAIGKGFAIGSAALVCVALFSAFVLRINENGSFVPEIINPYIFCSLFIGSMLPFGFSAMTMKSVGFAAKEMVEEVREQFKNKRVRDGLEEPNYENCVRVATSASLKEMIMPGVMVIMTPIVIGVIFDPIILIGILIGALLSGVQLAISMSNTGGAWDNGKKYIESGALFVNGVIKGKKSDEHKAAVIGDTVGDPLKDTSGPSLNILIKLMAIISLVFAQGFKNTSFLSKLLKVNN